MANEMQLLLLPSDVTHEELCKKAQKIWVNYFGVARSSCMSRLDKGVKRTKPCLTVTNIQKQRRATSHQSDVDLNVDFQEVEGAAARGSSGIWSERMAKELTFQKKQTVRFEGGGLPDQRASGRGGRRGDQGTQL